MEDEKNLMFRFDSTTGMEFFKRCAELKEDNEEERVKLLISMSKEGYPITCMSTNRTKEQVVEDLSKRHKILHIKPEEENDA
jgi:hypothetical protein